MDSSHSSIPHISIDIEEHGIKLEHPTFSGDMDTFQPAVKIECHDEFSKLESTCNKEEQYVTGEEDTSTSRNMKNNLIAAPSSSYELKCEEVDLGTMKIEEDEDTTSEVEGNESKEQPAAHKMQHSKYMRVYGEKLKKIPHCIKCKKKFSSKQSLDGHIVSLHGNNREMMNSITRKIHHCKHCVYMTVYKENLVRHMRLHGETKLRETFICIKCKKEFSSKCLLDGHIVAWHGSSDKLMNTVTNKIHLCKHCNYTTAYATSFNRHMRKHGEKPKVFDCVKCRKVFSSKHCLDSHIVVQHSNDDEMMNSVTCKIYCCDHCKYTTVRMTYLNQHRRKHGEKFTILHCIECKKDFWNKRNLDNHIVAHHGNNDKMMNSVTSKIHCCDHCKYITVHKTNLSQHRRKHKSF